MRSRKRVRSKAIPVMKVRKKGRAERVAKMLLDMALDGMNKLPIQEKERRLNSFCADASSRLRRRSSTSGSVQSGQGPLAARERA